MPVVDPPVVPDPGAVPEPGVDAPAPVPVALLGLPPGELSDVMDPEQPPRAAAAPRAMAATKDAAKVGTKLGAPAGR
jgi:hypothetical protein